MIFLLKYFKLCEYSCDIGLVDLSIGKFDGGVIGEQIGYTARIYRVSGREGSKSMAGNCCSY